jgi:hypothetical protein
LFPIHGTLQGERFSVAITNRRNPFRVATNLIKYTLFQGFKANPGLQFANAVIAFPRKYASVRAIYQELLSRLNLSLVAKSQYHGPRFIADQAVPGEGLSKFTGR